MVVKFTHLYSFLMGCLLLGPLFPNSAQATTYYVDDAFNNNDLFTQGSAAGNNSAAGTAAAPFATLTRAISVALANDIIYIDAGTYTTEINIVVNKPLTIIGAGIGVTIIDNNFAGTATNWFMHITSSNVILRDFTVTEYENNGTQLAPMSGQAITIGGTASLITGVLLENIHAFLNGQSGGNPAIQINGNSTAVLRGGGSLCNTAGTAYTGGVGVFGTNINLRIENYILANNYKDNSFDGGGLRVEGDATTIVNVFNTRIANNVASNGGGISQRNGVLNLYDCVLENNSAGQTSTNIYGGAFRITAGNAKFSRCIFKNNFQASGTLKGGAIAARYITDPNPSPISSNKIISVQVDSCVFENNSPATSGRDVYAANGSSNACTINMRDCRFLTAGNFNIFSDATSPATAINVTYTGVRPTSSGSNVTLTASLNAAYTPSPVLPTFSGTCATTMSLPIELVNFEGNCNRGTVELFWKTATETGNSFFSIEKAGEDMEFTPIGSVLGAGNSSSIKAYQYTDVHTNGLLTYYRLAQTDWDGNKSYSDVIAVEDCGSAQGTAQVFPNPFSHDISLSFSIEKNTEVSIELYNHLGQKLRTIEASTTYAAGAQRLSISTSDLPTATYFLRVSLDNQVQMLKISKI